MLNIESIPGVVQDANRSFFYILCPDFIQFRKIFREFKLPKEVPIPKSGGAMNDEKQVITKTGETYCLIQITGDHAGWKKALEEFCSLKGIQSAVVENRNLQVSDGRKISLAECTLKSSHGI